MATVSRVLANRSGFHPETRARVLAAADALGYDRSWTRRGRTSPAVTTVDIVLGEVSHWWSDRVVRGAWHAADRMGFDLTLTTEHDEDEGNDWTSRILRRGTGGVVLGLTDLSLSQLATLRAAKVPVVLLDPMTSSVEGVESVGTTDREGGEAAGAHLVEIGVRDFVLVQARPAYRFGTAREAGFRQAIERLGSEARLRTAQTRWDQGAAIPELAGLMADRVGVLGIFATNDAIALRCYESAAEAGLRVGADVLIVGFDDEARAARAEPPLTTIRQPIEQMAAKAVEIVCASSAEELLLSPARHEIPAHLIVRESTFGSETHGVDV